MKQTQEILSSRVVDLVARAIQQGQTIRRCLTCGGPEAQAHNQTYCLRCGRRTGSLTQWPGTRNPELQSRAMNGQLTNGDILATTRRDTERQPKAIAKTCDSCEQPFSVERPRERFCSACKAVRRRQQTREAMRRRRGVSIQGSKRPRIAKNMTTFMA